MEKEILDVVRGKDVVLYMRASTAEQSEKGSSFPAQREAVKPMIEDLELNVVAEYEETASGTIDNRPILKQATRYAKTHGCSAIIVAYASRHSRNKGFTAQWERDTGLVCLAADSYNKGNLEGGVLEVIDDHYISALKEKQRNSIAAIKEKFARGETHRSKKSDGKNEISRFGAPDLELAQANAAKGNKDKAIAKAQELFSEVKAIVESWDGWQGYKVLCDELNAREVHRRQKEKQNEVQKARGDKKRETTHKLGGLKSALFRMKQETREYKGKALPPLLNDEQRDWLKNEMFKTVKDVQAEQREKLKDDYKRFRESNEYKKLKKSPHFSSKKFTFKDFCEILDSGGKISLLLPLFTMIMQGLRV